MSFPGGLAFEHPSAASARPHYLSHATARTVADDGLFELWNGATDSARVLRVNLDGQIQLQNGSAAAPAVVPEGDKTTGIYFVTSTAEVAAAIGGTKVLSVLAAGVGVTGTLAASGAVTGSSFSGDGSALTALNGTQVTTGTIASDRLAGSYTGITAVGTLSSLTVTGSITSGGSTVLTTASSVAATSLTGTIASDRLSGAYTGVTGLGTLASLTVTGAVNAGSFSGTLTATDLTGTIASDRLSGSYAGITAVGTLSSLTVSGALSAGSLSLTSGLSTLDVSGAMTAGTLAVGGGTAITKILVGSTTWDPPTLTGVGTSGSSDVKNVTITGATVGDTVICSNPWVAAGRAVVDGAVSAADTVTLSVTNLNTASSDLASMTIQVIVLSTA